MDVVTKLTEDCSLIFPVFNEEIIIKDSIEKLRSDYRFRKAEIIFVNDGSTDNSKEIVEQFATNNMRLISRERHLGKGASIREGVMASSRKRICVVDADLPYGLDQPYEILSMLDRCDVCLGRRRSWSYGHAKNFGRFISSKIYRDLARFMLGFRAVDPQCGLKAYWSAASFQIFSRQTINGWGSDVETVYLAYQLGFRVHEYPVMLMESRPCRPSHFSLIPDALFMLGELFSTKLKVSLNLYE